MRVYIRPLELNDADVSWRWRNDDTVWHFTGRRPDRPITPDIEREWIKAAIQDESSHRFAIIVSQNGCDVYVGNVQIADIRNGTGDFHIFIGDKRYWGLGIATRASFHMLEYAFCNLGLYAVRLKVHVNNHAAKKIYERIGFSTEPGEEDGHSPHHESPWVVMKISQAAFTDSQKRFAKH